MKITKEYLGKRLLVRKSITYYMDPTEVSLLEVSPSGDYLKLEFVRADSTTYADWVSVDSYYLVEDLGYRVYKGYKKQSDSVTVSEEQYIKESRKAHERLTVPFQKELEKNKWVHGICNPPSPGWKTHWEAGARLREEVGL